MPLNISVKTQFCQKENLQSFIQLDVRLLLFSDHGNNFHEKLCIVTIINSSQITMIQMKKSWFEVGICDGNQELQEETSVLLNRVALFQKSISVF